MKCRQCGFLCHLECLPQPLKSVVKKWSCSVCVSMIYSWARFFLFTFSSAKWSHTSGADMRVANRE